MKPVAIFRHFYTEGPGYLGEFFDAHSISWQLIRIDANDAVPSSTEGYSGLVFMGGPMSVNDNLPWIAKVCALIKEAVERDIPVLGHCLGGQLISKALGGVVTRNPVKEIGWGRVAVADNDTAHMWFGEVAAFDAFHWHGETFTLPPGAVHVLSSSHCANQGYALGKTLGLQCHVEMTADMIREWCRLGAGEVAANLTSPGVQPVEVIEAQIAAKLPQMQKVAHALYSRWIGGLQA